MSSTQTAAKCPNCRQSSTRDLGLCCEIAELALPNTPDVIRSIAERFRSSRLLVCSNCDMRFRSPALSDEEVVQLYGNLPESIWQYDANEIGSWSAAKRFLVSSYKKVDSLQVLDVGAFDGSFLQQLPTNWQKSAIEPSRAGQDRLAEKGIPVIAEFVADIDSCYQNAFDVVTLFDVFEHLNAPAEVLSKVLNLVKPGGRLLVSTGNASHWTWRLLKGQHWYLHSVQHLSFATPEFFRRWSMDADANFEKLVKHAHHRASLPARLRQFGETIHAWSRMTGHSIVTRMIQTMPGFRQLRHKQGIAFANQLRDHQLAIFQRRKITNR